MSYLTITTLQRFRNLFLVLLLVYTSSYVRGQADPYLWLEDIEGEEQMKWVENHNQVTLEYLEGIEGFTERTKIAYEVITSEEKLIYPLVHKNYVYNFWQDEEHSRGIYRRTLLDDYLNKQYKWETILDVDELSAHDSVNWVFKHIQFAPGESSRCLLYLSPGGSDAIQVFEYDYETKSFIEEGFNLGLSKSSLAWIDENTVYVSTDFGDSSVSESGYPLKIKRWRRGKDLREEVFVLEGSATDMSVFPLVIHTDNSRYEFLLKFSDFYHRKVWYNTPEGLKELNLPDNFNFDILDDQLVLVPFTDWILEGDTIRSGRVVSVPLQSLLGGNIKYTVLFEPDARTSVEEITATSEYLLLNILSNIQSKLLKFTWHDNLWKQEEVGLPGGGAIEIIEADHRYPQYFASYESFLQPTSIYYDADDGSDPKLIMNLKEYFDAAKYVMHQYEARSADGTLIPYFVIHDTDLVYDGNNPTILYGYGGFNVSEKPYYSPNMGLLWLEKGGVYVLANIRGGGEFGPEWHDAAIKEKKQRSYDDFIAVADDLQKRKITSAAKLGITGGSNGGLLVGAVMTQRPDLFKAVACYVPLLDMKRYNKLLAGKSWEAEYGNPDIPEEWEYISKYSPYQNLHAGEKYPTVLFLTSTRDDRVHPGHARKMAASMEELGNRIYLFENTEGGHNASYTPDHVSRMVAMNYSFFTDQLMGEDL